MQTRTDFYTASPDAMKAMRALEAAVGKLSIELPLLELVRLRVSQINGCAFCLDHGDQRRADQGPASPPAQ